jgi:DNA polymerase
MRAIFLDRRADAGEWREVARALLCEGVAPREVTWRVGREESLFAGEPDPAFHPRPDICRPRVPRAFLDLVETVVCHSDPDRFALLYRLLARLQDERQLLTVASDPDVVAARRMEKAVRRDCHKMTAFVRFREVPGRAPTAGRRRFAAWFEPDHFIVDRTAHFFAGRFADMDWIIMTPKGTAAFEDGVLTVSDEPAERPSLADATDALWAIYYASIFNPARLKLKAMQAEMPKKYWKNLPETALIPGLVAGAQERVAAMARQEQRQPPAFHQRLRARQREESAAPPADMLAALREEALTCTRCPLHCEATQTVFGEGPRDATLMIVGEQPGDHEDLAGRPFVGPAGKLLDRVLVEAGIDRRKTYLTNAVKHFKFEPRGKRRLHRSPNAGEIAHCRWWLGKELDVVRPRLVVAMGATAMLALTGRKARLTDSSGRIAELEPGRALLITVHPAYLLRIPDQQRAEEETRRFRDDLMAAHRWLETDEAPPRIAAQAEGQASASG